MSVLHFTSSLLISYQSLFCNVRKLQHPSEECKEMRMKDTKSEPGKDLALRYPDNSKSIGTEMFSAATSTCILLILLIHYKIFCYFIFFLIFQDAHENDKDVEDSAGEQDRNAQKDTNAAVRVSTTDRTVHTPALVPRQRHGTSRRSEGPGCCEPLDSDREQCYKLRNGFAQSWVYPPELNRNLWDPGLFQPSQPSDCYSGATVDTAVQSRLSLAAHVRTPGPAGCSVGLHQHTLVQVHRRLTNMLLLIGLKCSDRV